MEQRRNSENPRDREVIQEIKEMLEKQVQTLDEKNGANAACKGRT